MRLLALAATLATVSAAEDPANPWFREMQIGPAWSNTFADVHQGADRIAAMKGILLDLGEGHRALFDTESLRFTSIYKGDVRWGGTPWTGSHGALVRANSDQNPLALTAAGPGWADAQGSFAESRPTLPFTYYGPKKERSEQVLAFGDVPQGEFRGYFRHGSAIVLDYAVLGTRILDHPALVDGRFVRFLEVAPHDQPLRTRLADDAATPFTLTGPGTLEKTEAGLVLEIPPSDSTVTLAIAAGPAAEPKSLAPLLAGGPGLWDGEVKTQAKLGEADEAEPWAVDTLTLPTDNPWKANLRFGGFDFLDADTAALSTWNGDVWLVSGLKEMKTLAWKRFASGLFETLGLKVVDGIIHVNGRDQITRLHDLNGDREADHFEVFNRDVDVSPNFHEFAFGLQTDDAGNFYYAKAAPVRPGGRNFDTILPHHGTVVRVSPDGSESEVIATGLRAPGGLGVGPDGEITTGENEGTWQPCCKINYATKDQLPVFFGTEQSRHQLADHPYTEPLCYLPMDVDNSGGGQVWVPEGANFGLRPGELLHLSYGRSTIYRVLPETVDGTLQGGVVPLPVKLQSSAMRARFHPDGHLFALGFRGWQTNAATESAFHRIRFTDTPVTIPDQLHVTPTGVRIRFEVPLDPELAEDPFSFSVQRWDYVRGPQYGSGEFSVDQPDAAARETALDQPSKNLRQRDDVEVLSAKLLPDGRTIELELDGHKPSMQLKVAYDLETEDGEVLDSAIHSTVRAIPSN